MTIGVSLRVCGDGGPFVVRARAASIRRAEELAAAAFPGNEVEVVFPIDGDAFFSGNGGVEELEASMPERVAG